MKYLGAVSICCILGACSTTSSAVVGVQAVLTSYGDIVQPAIIEYERLPNCSSGSTFCSNPTEVAKLKILDKTATAAIDAATPVIEGKQPDTGQMAAAVIAIIDVQTELKNAKAK